MKKNLDFYCFLASHDFYLLKNNVRVNVHSKRNKHKNLEKKKFVGVLKVTDENSRIRVPKCQESSKIIYFQLRQFTWSYIDELGAIYGCQ
jgi:hypothetical protein